MEGSFFMGGMNGMPPLPPDFTQRMEAFLKSEIDRMQKMVTIKTFPAKPEWIAQFADIDKEGMEVQLMKDAVEERFKRIDAKKRLVWSAVELDLSLFGKRLRWNNETKEIELQETTK